MVDFVREISLIPWPEQQTNTIFRKSELNNVAATLLQLLHVLLSPPLQEAVIFWDLFYLPKSEIWTGPYHVDTQTGVRHLIPLRSSGSV